MSEYEKLTQLTLEKVEIAAQLHMSEHAARRIKLEIFADHAARSLVFSIQSYMWGNQVHREVTGRVRFHASWWQGFKASFFPDWLKRHYPVRFEERETSVKLIHTCPHLNIETRDDEKVHLRYLAAPDLLRVWDA